VLSLSLLLLLGGDCSRLIRPCICRAPTRAALVVIGSATQLRPSSCTRSTVEPRLSPRPLAPLLLSAPPPPLLLPSSCC